MKYEFSNRISGIKPSAIREILKLSSDPSVIAFSAGNPSADSFPREEIDAYADEILRDSPVLALQYGATEGYAPLRDVLKERCKTVYKSFKENEDELIVTTGAQQVFDLLTKACCNEGDTIIAEGPAFVGALSAFRSHGAVVKQVEVGDEGMDLDEVEAAIKSSSNPRFIYCIPNFQNPSGRTMPLEKRRALLYLATKYNMLILEDNAYADIRFHGEFVPPIKSFDTEGRVVYVGSMSKLLSPGLRVGFVSAAPEVVGKMVIAKQVADVHTPMLNQMICHSFLTRSDVKKHVETINKIYRHKCDLMLKELDREIGGRFDYTRPDGGLFIWGTLPEDVDMMAFVRAAIDRRVAVVPGNTFYADTEAKCSGFRMNFSSPSDENIVAGVKILGEVTKEMIG